MDGWSWPTDRSIWSLVVREGGGDNRAAVKVIHIIIVADDRAAVADIRDVKCLPDHQDHHAGAATHLVVDLFVLMELSVDVLKPFERPCRG